MNKLIAFLAIPLLLVVILGSALAMWYDTLKIKATISTGNVDVEFSERIGQPIHITEVGQGNEYGKPWVANCSASLDKIEDEDLGNPYGDNDYELNITIVNGYPCFGCKVENLNVYNSGTIPVKFKIVSVTAGLLGGTMYSCTKVLEDSTTYYKCDVNNDTKDDIHVWGCFTSLEGQQLDPGNWTSFTFETHIKQGAPENSTIIVQIKIRAIQWNEYS